MASVEKIVTTLTAEAGKNPGEAIGSYRPGKRSHIVFLPRDVQVGERVRVELHELDKTDSRGNAMYRAVPTPEEAIERWIDNGDGTASRVEILVDWRFNERQTGVLKTRQLASRDGSQYTRSEYSVRWGQDLASSIVEELRVTVTPLEVEQVENYALVWKRTGEREEQAEALEHLCLRVEVGSCQLATNKLAIQIDPTWTVQLKAAYRPANSSWDSSVEATTTWGASPSWWQTEWLTAHPECACGRQRYDVSTPDGFAKCELCRKEAICDRCAKVAGGVTNIAGRLVCSGCQSYEKQEQLINKLVPVDVRRAVARQASAFLAADPILEGEAGEIVLKSTLDHIADEWRRDDLGRKYIGYGWYYFCADGVWASKLSPDALQVLAHLEHATGDGLVELIAWVAGEERHKTAQLENSHDYYYRAQVLREAVAPALTEHSFGKLSVGVRLRGSEKARIAAVAGYRMLTARLGNIYTREIANQLFGDEQDYSSALSKIREMEDTYAIRQSALEQGELIDGTVSLASSGNGRTAEEAWAIAPDGSQYPNTSDHYSRVVFGDLPGGTLVIRHGTSNYGYRSREWWQVESLPRALTDAQRRAVAQLEKETRVYFSGARTGWKLDSKERVEISTAYSRDFAGRERDAHNEMCAAFPIDLACWQVVRENDILVVQPRRLGPAPRAVATPQPTQPVTPQPEAKPVQVLWEQSGGRNVRCTHCSATERMTKGQLAEFEDGKEIVFECVGCRRRGSVKRTDA